MARWPRLVASMSLLAIPLGKRAEKRYQQMQQVQPLECPDKQTPPSFISWEAETTVRTSLPSISIIIPARNEAQNLQRLLPSLCRLQYPGKLEIIVVDDHSEDETAAVARQYGLRVISLDQLPSGWLGKPHACHNGAAHARNDWLLFTDADTVHAAHGLAQVLKSAQDNQFDGITLHLGHKTKNWLDGATLMAAFAGLFAGLPSEHATMNGQYILLRRDVYEKSGGFRAVRQEPLEDLALGARLKRMGYHAPMLRGESVAQVAMYSDYRQLWRGMSRLGAGSLRFAGAGSLVTVLFITALMSPFLALRLVLTGELGHGWFWLAWGAAITGVRPWAGRFGPRRRVILAPVGALIIQLSALWGLFNRLIGRGIRWKGRSV